MAQRLYAQALRKFQLFCHRRLYRHIKNRVNNKVATALIYYSFFFFIYSVIIHVWIKCAVTHQGRVRDISAVCESPSRILVYSWNDYQNFFGNFTAKWWKSGRFALHLVTSAQIRFSAYLFDLKKKKLTIFFSDFVISKNKF